MRRRVLFVIRGKLGDTLVAFATVRRFADDYPQDEVLLLTRANYASLLGSEKRVRIIGFSSRVSMLVQLMKLRLGAPFDALLVLWGFGAPIRWIGRLVRARRKIYLDGRYADVFPEYVDMPADRLQSEPMWRVAKAFEPALAQPERLELPSLVARRDRDPDTIGIAPLADEARRILSPAALSSLLHAVVRWHPHAKIKVFVNPTDRGAAPLLAAGLPQGADFCFFPRLDDLVRGFSDLAHLYCTDTGLYHLAASMGIPATVFFGPTQPWKILMPAQPATRGVRLAALGGAHCEEKACESPACLHAAIMAVAGEPAAFSLDGTLPSCPLRAFPSEALSMIAWHAPSWSNERT